MDPSQNFPPPMLGQFRPVVPSQQPQQFVSVPTQHFQPVAMMNAGFPSQTPQPQFPQVMPQLPARPGQPGHILPAPPAVSLPAAQPNQHVNPGASLPQPNIQTPTNYFPGVPAAHLSSSYTFAPSSYCQVPVSHNAMAQYQPMAQLQVPSVPIGGQVGVHVSQSTSVTSAQQIGEQISFSTATIPIPIIQPKPTEEASIDWIEHTSANGRRYYYNKKTRQSSWEKPLELMSPIERADASTNWKEYTTPDGRKYYFNKATNLSTWSIPEELKLAREQVEMASAKGTQSEVSSHMPAPVPPSSKAQSDADTSSTIIQGASSSPVSVVPVPASSKTESVVVSGSDLLVATSTVTNVHAVQTVEDAITPSVAVSESSEVSFTETNAVTTPMNIMSKASSLDMIRSAEGVSTPNADETVKDVVVSEKINNSLEEKAIDQESLTYASKQEAKDAFKALLESANVGSEWTWDQAMRVIINDKRYGALRTLGERKQAFNEILGQKKKHEAEERRVKQKKAREEYKKMLEESSELISSTRWSKAIPMFEDDERYKAVEREKDRKDLFENYIDELRQKERVKAQEQRKQSIMEYRQFLESCDFIKANSQWRKVQDRLETDVRCSRLDKIDRLEIFQEYIRDLEKEEEEQRRIQKEELRKTERKNRDEFRKLMEEHVAAATLTAKTHWRDYCMMVKDSPPFLAVASNTSGPTPKDLFEDVAEELQKQYDDDKVRVKDAVKSTKISLASTWTLEDLRAAIFEDISSPPISDVNLKLIFEDLLERVKEKEEKEAKKRKRLADGFFDLLQSVKEITSSSAWEECKHLLENSPEFSSIRDEASCKEIFEEYVKQLKGDAKEKERRRKEDKAKKEKREKRGSGGSRSMEGTKREDTKEKRRNTRGRDLQMRMSVQVNFTMKTNINGQEKTTVRDIINDIEVQWITRMKVKKIGLSLTGIAVITGDQKGMHRRPNPIAKPGIRNIGETIGTVPVERPIPRSLKMESLVRGKVSSSSSRYVFSSSLFIMLNVFQR
ncbi:pre-mRNA-processing protein 40A-like [Hibiscus syriacus]|uniref:pre-mRNA-processing protein 40A-like n=1 Tax=Hibiscus syriacus TaxID=106335 RepID=UPI00192351BB|nr:pre-mRNA-processing protein 40A-like [Hibiscus syriacus]XP_039038777.1 pre-mRNA-processing protein 40A-like [Hibiscus syriacus]XP_039038778.1 pre-mRNA-processing protein 40A-like [Hibiscus syriacus]XP_039038779.1 pre-mRNA-processing protein 40A-like [Hibiscus syriacus]XP_039038780.1 pre-mRNA-processing protein 40A-like [Hibiscus syriacus]